MLYLADKKAKLFKGDYKPVSLYLGNEKTAGYEYAEQTGEYLDFEGTYNDSAYLKANGKTLEIGEGEKSPDNPYELKSVGDDGGFDLVSAGKNLFDVESALAYFPNIEYDSDIGITLSKSDTMSWVNKPVFITLPAGTYYFSTTGNKARLQIQDENSEPIATNVITPTSISLNRTTGLKIKILTETSTYPWVIGNFQISATATPYTPFRGMQTIHIPYTLRSLPDGTRDYIEIDNVTKTAKLVRNVGEVILNGSESPISTYTYNGLLGCRIPDILPTTYTRAIGICTHENRVGEYYDISGTYMWLGVANRYVYWIGILDYLGFDDVSEFAQWATAQHSAGTPVTIQYKLATPTITELDYEAVKTYYPYTQIYTTATVQPTLEGKIRVWEA